jgi:DNA-directed RNA polymerase subunit beta'
VIEPGLTDLKQYQLLTEDEYQDKLDEFGEDSFKAGIGAEAIKEILASIDLQETKTQLREELANSNSEAKRKKVVKRLKIIESFIDSNTKPEWMILDVLPVIPPELRPLVPLDGGRFATSDLNDLYRRVINRNNRLKRLIELRAPDIIIRNEKRMLQESVDALFDNGRRSRAITGTNKRPLKSLSDMLKGKQGRFRQNLLGKRVDYSGRSVITVGPQLKLHQCGLPKKMALELFKPFVYAKLELYGLATTIKAAKRMVEKERVEVWDILEEVIREHPVLLNRAPTLHRLGIQAFEPVLVEGKAIHLHPLVCTAFNADFDGDQMAVHVPLSIEAQLEARVLMMSTNNILAPASGKPIIVPSQDMVLGIYYLSYMADGVLGEGSIFSDINEVMLALNAKTVDLHAKIKCRMHYVNDNGERVYGLLETTPGRIIISDILPDNEKISISLVNRLLRKKEIGEIIDTVYRFCGQKETCIMVDKIMTLGFENACKAGISFGKDDMVVPEAKKTLIAETSKQVKEIEQQYQNGLITKGEKYNKVIDIWAACNYKIADEMMKTISKVDHGYMNSIFMMADSGARGSKEQMRQLGGMRGLMAKPNGAIIEQPIISNFKEGLTVSEFFSSTHGARKGLSDTALKTANSGYLTRRLVDVAQDVVVTETNCGTERGIIVRPVVDGGNVIASIGERILGRTAQEDIVNPETGEVIVQKGRLINENDVDRVEKAGVEQVKIRSVLTCESEHGVCAACYGRDLARGTPVNVGEAVGVIAAQSIGEPGTQLTMRTFHIGGAASASAAQSSIEVPFSGILKLENAHTVENVAGHLVVLSRNCEILITDGQGREKSRHRIPYGTEILVKEGTEVEKGQKVAEWDPFTVPVISEKGGKVELVDLINGISMKESQDETTGVVSKIVTDWRGGPNSQANLRPSIVLKDKKGKPVTFDNGREVRYYLSADAVLAVDNGTEINPGDIIARLPKESLKSKDITGGLPRVAELFEARKPKDPAIISDVDGIVEFGKDYKSKQRIVVKDANEKEWEYLVPKGRRLVVQDGDNVKKGDMLVEGTPAPHDILRVLGVEKLAEYLVKEVQDVYRMQGVKINDKHIEVIVSQMLRKVEVTNPGDTTLLIGEQLDADEFEAENQKTINEGGTPAEATPVLLGITKASLQTKSFISAASFQETTRVLTEAAVQGKVDKLHGLKENVIVGRLVPAGTGSVLRSLKKVAAQNDHAIEQMKQEEAAAAIADRTASEEA